MRVLRFISTTVIIVSIFSLSINLYSIWVQYSDIKKVCSVAVSHAQKNGGITSETVQLLEDLLRERGLDQKVSSIRFYPGVDIPVQKRDSFLITIKPLIKLNIPFVGEQVYETSNIEASGYSHKYFK